MNLPTGEEPKQILEINQRRAGADLEQLNTHLVALSTKGRNGAELEQAVVAARIEA